MAADGDLIPMARRPFKNRNLFSNHYLENQVRASPELARSDHEAAFAELKRIYEREAAFVAGLSEAQLEERLIRRVFAVILPEYEVQGATRSREFPDYAFFPHREARDRAPAKKGSGSFLLEAFAIAWGERGGERPRAPGEPRNPGCRASPGRGSKRAPGTCSRCRRPWP